MSSIKVSIIVPVYNGERFISKCIDSIICQTLRNIEIICVNDGSTDMSLEILKRYADKDNRIKIISTRNKGQGNARNIAIEHAVGEFIGFVDIDDWVDPEMFEELYSVGNQFLCDVVISEFNLYNERTKKISQPEWCKIPNYKAFDNRVFIAEDIMDYVFKLHSAPWSKIYRTQFIKSNKVKFPVGLYYEDISFVFKCILFSKNIKVIRKAFYNYTYLRKGSESDDLGERQFDIFPVLQKLEEDLMDEGFLLRFKLRWDEYKVSQILFHFDLVNNSFKFKYWNMMRNIFFQLDRKSHEYLSCANKKYNVICTKGYYFCRIYQMMYLTLSKIYHLRFIKSYTGIN